MRCLKIGSLFLIPLLLTACFGSNTQPQISICDELDEHDEWVEPVQQAQAKYQVPAPLLLVLLELPLSELDKAHVRPRASDWEEFRIRSERWDADPRNVEDAVAFAGWYVQQSAKRNQLAANQYGEHYLAVRLGHGGYHRFDRNSYPELLGQAKNVQLRGERWQRELAQCPKLLNDEGWLDKLKLW